MPHLIRIGNSLGLRIPKPIITQLGFSENTILEFIVTHDGLLVSPKKKIRDGWDKAFRASKSGKEKLLVEEDLENQFDKDDWVW